MKVIQLFLKIIYWSSVVLITFCVITQILFWLLPLELSDNASVVFSEIRFYGFTVAVLLTLTGTVKQADSSEIVMTKVVGTLVFAGMFFLIMIGTALSGMCSWSTEKVYFEDIENSSIKIVERHFGCGATDSGEPMRKVFKVNELTGYLFWIKEVDTVTIDKSRWKRL